MLPPRPSPGDVSPSGRCPCGSSSRDAKPCSPAEEGEAAAGTPEGAGPAPAAPRALCTGLPSWETVQDSPDQKREQIQKELRGGARRYACGEGGGCRARLFPEQGVGKPAAAREPAPLRPPGRGAAAGRACSRSARAPTSPHPPAPADQAPRPLFGGEPRRATRRGGRPLSLLLRPGLPSPNLPGMVGRWHARLCQAPLHREGEEVEGAEEELGRSPGSWQRPHQLQLRM